MNKRIFIIGIYLMSLLIFSIIADLNEERFLQYYMETMEYGNILVTLAPSLIAEFLHIIITIIIAIIIKFSNKIDLETKRIFYRLPIFTIFLWIPVAIISCNIVF